MQSPGPHPTCGKWASLVPGSPEARGRATPPASGRVQSGCESRLHLRQRLRASVSAQFESTMGAVFVIRHQAARGLAFICAVVLAGNPGPPLIRHVRSTITQRGLVNSLLQLGKLNAITRVFVTDPQSPASHLPSRWMLQSEESGHAFPGNYLLPAIILRIL